MPTIALQAHFDGTRIVLDEEYVLSPNAELLITVLPAAMPEETEAAWLRAAACSEPFDFLQNPAEDIYTVSDGEPFRDAL